MRVWMRAAGVGLLALGGCMSTPPEQDPVQLKLRDLDTRLARIERVIQNQSLLELSNQIESLRADVRSMHNDVDQLSNSMDSLRRQQRDVYADLDHRMKALEARASAAPVAADAAPPSAAAAGAAVAGAAAAGAAAGAAAAGTTAVTGTAAPGAMVAGAVPPTDTSVYQTAFGLLKDGQYDRAVQAFQQFLYNYPSSQLADNAQYWLGEAYYVNRSFPDAQSAFQRVVDKYPQSRKIPDAMLKIGYCRYEMKLWESARAVLEQLISQYPDAPAANLARERLDKMSLEKH